ncbi:sulfonate transport system permease protein [Arboricoccus pini]|uniref:Sulfonate transport system permease protein n=1 Tax=Arboricoccus pini TaxID=1963835 RepID=A0A212RFH0_9PROT|nr:sulfonate transport system permease protein [Arboricoccus pini]
MRRGLTLPLILLLAWELASRLGLADPRILPPASQVLLRGWAAFWNDDLLGNLLASLTRDLAGFSLGTLAGLCFGTLLGLSRLGDRLLGPSFHGLKQIAIFAWIPLISMWFGIGELAKIVFIAIAAFVPVVLNTEEGMRGASRQLIEVGRVLTFNRRQRLTRIFLPSALPAILTGIQLALMASWLATIGTEYFMTVGPGIGGLIIEGRERFEMDQVMLGILILGVVGFALNAVAGHLGRVLTRYETA